MTTDQNTTTEPPELELAFVAGACAAYDDCGHDIPPLWCITNAEKDAWKRGLKSGYQDVDRLIQKDVDRLIQRDRANDNP